ncbi:MAG: hypothetical protein AB8E82_00640 [Aureispira sp.]
MNNRVLSKENLLVLLLQAILCLIAFNKFFVHPTETLFMDLFDGIKNYFTFQSYLQQDASVGLALVNGHAYPFGDYLFYADLTPSIAVPLRFFSLYIYDISDYGIPIFNTIIILLHWIAALVAYRLTKHFVQTPWLAVLIAISLTWINPQLGRLGNGHFNLSIIVFILLTLLFLVHIYKGYLADPERYFSQNKRKLLALLITLYVASFTHLYFLPILGLTIGFFALFYAVELKFYKKQSWINSLKPLAVLGITCFLGLVAVLGTILLVDDYYSLRAVGNSGYDFADWKLSIASLFTAREFNYIRYFFSYSQPIHYETNLYMGAFTLYGLTFLLLLKLFGKSLYLSIQSIFAESPFVWPMLGAAFFCFFVALGDQYYFLDSQYYFKNYLNPFFYLRKFVSTVEQFRCLARFFWPAFWIFSLALAACVDYYYRKHQHQAAKLAVGCLALLAVSDTKDVITFQNRAYKTNYFAKQWDEMGYEQLGQVDFAPYQALLPLPYFHASSEVKGYVLDGGTYYNRLIQFIGLRSKLPMMSVQSSRLPLEHTQHLFSMFDQPQPNQALLDQLNDKPILVLYHKGFHKQMSDYGDFVQPTDFPAKEVVIKGSFLPDYYNMTKVAEDHTFIMYEWNMQSSMNDVTIQHQQHQQWDMEQTFVDTSMSATDSATSNYLQTQLAKDIINDTHAYSGQQSIVLSPSHPRALQHLIHKVSAGTLVEVTAWRKKSTAYGAFVLEGKNYNQTQETVVKEEGEWQQIKALFNIPTDYKDTSLELYYWNTTPNNVYLDDFELKIYPK